PAGRTVSRRNARSNSASLPKARSKRSSASISRTTAAARSRNRNVAMLHRLIAALMLATLCAAPASAQQAAFPDKTIRVIVPFAAGGGVDVKARLFGEKAGPILGMPIIVEKRAGASGTIGGQAVHQSAPDGTTLLFVPL